MIDLPGNSPTHPAVPDAMLVVHPADGPVVDDRVLADTARLRAVEALGLLDTGDEQPFDRWAQRATELTGAGSALLSLVDERRSFFKSFRLSDGTAGDQREVPISTSLCREVVVRGQPLIVEDAANDPRTKDYGAVAAFPVGAYAGIPLLSENGNVLGSFCVVDSAPRAWTSDQLSALADLAAAAQAELQLRTAGHQNRRQVALMDAHQRVHALMLDGAPRRAVLAEFVSGVEMRFSGMRGSVVLEEDVDLGEEGPLAQAVRTGLDVIAVDLASENLWPALRAAALESGPASCWAVPILGSDGLTLGALALWSDTPRAPFEDDLALLHQAARLAAIVLERDGASVELIRLATTDPLTGLPNRDWLLARLGEKLAAETGARETAVLFCDLDEFKQINDSYGHQTGDVVLTEIARRIAAAIRPGDLVARLGGDEFVVVLGDVHGLELATECATRLEHALAAPIPLLDGGTQVVRASVGVALVNGVSAEEALRRSDVAMYHAKGTANRVGVFDPGADGEASQRWRTLEALRLAVDKEELDIVYRPVVDLAAGRAISAETRIRWRQNLTPGASRALPDGHGQIAAIGRWVIGEAIDQAARWHAVGERRTISLSLTAEQLKLPTLATDLLRRLADAELPPGALEVVVSDSAELTGGSSSARNLTQLRDAGTGVLLANFGLGLSSLSHLRALPITGANIDRSFVAHCADRPAERRLLGALIAVTDDLGIRAIAHGVETAEQAMVLRELGCGYAQGDFFGRAVPADRLGGRWAVLTAGPSSDPEPFASVAVESVIGQKEPVGRADSAGTQSRAWPVLGWLAAVTAAVLAVYALDIFFGVLPTDLSEIFKRFALPTVFFGAACQCALRARAPQSEASAWWLFSLALMAWGGGSLYYGAVFWDARVVPLPSPADGLWIVFYVFAYAALFRLLRSRVGTMRGTLGLDAAICALAAAGALAAATLPNSLAQGGQSTVALLTTAAYPLGDLGLLAMLVAAMSLIGLKGSGAWPLISLTFAIFVVTDSVYLAQVANGTYRPGGVLDLGWPLAAILLGGAAGRSGEFSRLEPSGNPTVALPAASGLLALGLLLYGQFWSLHIAGLVLAIATIIVVLLRLFQLLQSNKRLSEGLTRDIAERRRVAAVLYRNEARLRKTEEVVGCGSWELSLNGEKMSWSDGFLRVYGLAPGAEIELGMLTSAIHPDDRAVVRDAVSSCIGSGGATVEHRITRPDGAVRTLIVEGELVPPTEERFGYLRGSVLDVTDERAAFDAAPMGMLVAEPLRLRLLRVNDALCTMLARTREDLIGRSIEELTHPDDRAIVARQRQLLIDSDVGNHQSEKRYLRPDGSVVWAAIYVTPIHNADGSVKAFSSQVIDITEEKRRTVEIQMARVDSLRRLAIASEYRDNETHEHTERVAQIACNIARTLGVTEARLDLLGQAAPLHDIGKVGISDLILLKPGPLTPDERKAMERHTLIGADILTGSESPVLQMAEEIALTHHERWDGEGYPHNLCGEDIPLLGRVVAIADVFDALTHARPYKEAWSVERAAAHIRSASGSQFDPYVVTAFNALNHASLPSPEPSRGGPVAGTPRHAEAAGLPRGRGLLVAQDDERIADRDHAAADRDRAASARDHTAADRDRSEAEADQRTSDRDDAASDRDHAASARDLIALARDRSAARADRQTAHREHAASDREVVASDRDDLATGRDESQADADPDQRSAESDPERGAHRPRAAAARAQSAVNADQRTSDRGHAVDDRERAASDREQTASDRDRAQVEAGRRASDRDDAAADREHASADSLQTASDRDQAQMEADQRLVNRDSAAADRALAAADRDQAAADRRAATIDRDRARDQLHRAQIDQLTGALGRALGIVTLGREINRARHGNGKLVLAFIDVDGLKEVNDLQGHATGDLLLKQAVTAMQASLRSYDPIVRYGGDEFICALVDATPAEVEHRFEEVRAKLALAHPGATISVGLAALRPGDTLAHLTERGDAALYRAKRAARSAKGRGTGTG